MATPDRADEEKLVARLREGDPAAYDELVRNQSGRMLAVSRRLLRSEEDARDAVQDAFLSAFKSIDKFQGSARLSTWLHRIVVNVSLMKLRSRRRRPEEPIDDLLPQFLADGHHAQPPAEWKLSPDEALARSETRELVREQIDRLPDTHRTVLMLRDIEELDTDEAAQLLGITPNAVKIRLHRARLALRQLLDPHMREERR